MKPFKAVVLAVLLSVTACVGSDPGAVSSLAVGEGDGSDQVPGDQKNARGSEDPEDAASGTVSTDGSSPKDSSSDPDSGGPGTGPDSGGGGPVAGPDSGGGSPDGGGGGNPDPGGGGGGITSNFHNWTGWNDANSCPPWNPDPYSWKNPRTSGVGTQSCGYGDVVMVGGLYESFLSPSANAASQAQWLATHTTCASCAISNWSDPTWGPVVRTPNGHYILNQAGCIALKDPGRKSCALSNWQFQQCGREACDQSADQTSYQVCVNNSSNVMVGVCGEAANGLGKANNVLYPTSSPAWSGCIASGQADNDKQVAALIVTGQCY